jgi:hypothetical protein
VNDLINANAYTRVKAHDEESGERTARLRDEQNAGEAKPSNALADVETTEAKQRSTTPGNKPKKTKHNEDGTEIPVVSSSQEEHESEAAKHEQTTNTANGEQKDSNSELSVRALVSSLAQLATDMLVGDILLAGAVA